MQNVIAVVETPLGRIRIIHERDGCWEEVRVDNQPPDDSNWYTVDDAGFGKLHCVSVKGRTDVHTGIFSVEDCAVLKCQNCGRFMDYDKEDAESWARVEEAMRDA